MTEAQAMTREFKAQPLDPVENGRSGIMFQGTCIGVHHRDIAEIIVSQLNRYDQAQAETIRRLEDLLESAKENERFLRDTPWLQENASLQARLTASEAFAQERVKCMADQSRIIRELSAAKKWTTERPTVPGWYWFRSSEGHTPECVHVVDEEIALVTGSMEIRDPNRMFGYGCEWQGPLTVPGESDEHA